MLVPTGSFSRRGPSLLVLAVATVVSLFACNAEAQPASANATASHLVVIQQMRFEPAEMSAQPGDTIEWKNDDIFTHTVTAVDGSFESGPIAPGHSWKTVIKNAGTLAYHCTPHPNMKGRLFVSGGSAEMKPNGEAISDGRRGESETLRWVPPTSPQQIHPILVNFTAALLPLALLSDLLGRFLRRPPLHNAAWWMVLYAAAITPLTVAAGWWWKHAAGPDLPARLITVHQWLGTAAAVIFLALAGWRWSIHRRGVPPSVAYLACAALGVLVLIYQGSLGGTMVFGR